ncbi:MAG TPA: prepilin peptidase [Gaiellaceae bacterium]|nr:prepilin peptidase [Gaiellaceae bacterium]
MYVALAAAALPPALALGSFLNVVAARLPEGRSLVAPPSACGACGARIAWHDNVPILSYLLLRGRCRSCGGRIGLRYVAVEALTGLLVAACFLHFGLTADAFVASFFVAVLVVLSAIDFERRILPDKIVLPSFVAVLAAQVALHPDRALEWVVASLAASGFLLAALLAYPKGMGMGDVKLALLLGAMLGWTVAAGLMVGMVAALVPSIVLLARHGAAARTMGIPFGPFLALGAVVALFWGDALLSAYLGAL